MGRARAIGCDFYLVPAVFHFQIYSSLLIFVFLSAFTLL